MAEPAAAGRRSQCPDLGGRGEGAGERGVGGGVAPGVRKAEQPVGAVGLGRGDEQPVPLDAGPYPQCGGHAPAARARAVRAGRGAAVPAAAACPTVAVKAARSAESSRWRSWSSMPSRRRSRWTTQRDQAEELARRAARLREEVLGHDALIDRDAVWQLKREALELLHEVPRGPGRQAEYEAYLRREGEWLRRHALWNALAEEHGPDRQHWPKGLRHPDGPQVEQAEKELAERVEFHRWLAWQVDQQLAHAQRAAREAGMPVGLIHDLAVGVHPDGADAWALQDVLADGISVGAPPDAFNAHGQDWGLPPWRPDALAEAGYAPFAELLRATARHAGALRIDHVMGLFRLWWVPKGHPPTEGAYVRYDAEAMLGVLALEAHRAGTAVIGEDLGTVEPGVREELAERGVLGTSVLWFERDWQAGGAILGPDRWRPGCLATLTTHDLPSTAARLSGEHVELRHRLGLLARPLGEEQEQAAAELADWRAELAGLGLLGPDEPLTMPVLYRFLRATPAELVGVWLPDLVGDPRPQNLPGTWDQYPNWRLPVADGSGGPVTLERLATAPAAGLLAQLLAVPDSVRRTPTRAVP
ncbi:4-alpha-glucanotransferase [Kitasatospora sp. NPDC091257]|uniref:4-alpha-glucanotransferase n=1 Tax=Kitasatospora sp. NPDC091257 TaxID=3364084 RepID=UPI00382D603D